MGSPVFLSIVIESAIAFSILFTNLSTLSEPPLKFNSFTSLKSGEFGVTLFTLDLQNLIKPGALSPSLIPPVKSLKFNPPTELLASLHNLSSSFLNNFNLLSKKPCNLMPNSSVALSFPFTFSKALTKVFAPFFKEFSIVEVNCVSINSAAILVDVGLPCANNATIVCLKALCAC